MKIVYDANLGSKFGKPDLERCGLFVEPTWIHQSKFEDHPTEGTFRALKGAQFQTNSTKIKTGLNDVYFTKTYQRLFEGERPLKRKPAPEVKKFIPIGEGKQHSSPNDNYGTFTSEYVYFSSKKRPAPKVDKKTRQFGIIPSKQGNSGYANIGLNPYPSHFDPRHRPVKVAKMVMKGGPIKAGHADPYFDPNPYANPKFANRSTYVKQKPGKDLSRGLWKPIGPPKMMSNVIDGYFSKYPEYKSNKPKAAKKSKESDKVWHYQSRASKTYYWSSVLNMNVDFRTNARTYETKEPTHIKKYIKLVTDEDRRASLKRVLGTD